MEFSRNISINPKNIERNLKSDLTNFFRNYFSHYDNASVTALISFKLDDNSEDNFIKVNLAAAAKHFKENQNLRIVTNPITTATSKTEPEMQEIVSRSSIKENHEPNSSRPKSLLSDDLDEPENDLYVSEEENNTRTDEESTTTEIKNIFLSQSYDTKLVSKRSDRRKSKRPQRKEVFDNHLATETAIRGKFARLSDCSSSNNNSNPIGSSSNVLGTVSTNGLVNHAVLTSSTGQLIPNGVITFTTSSAASLPQQQQHTVSTPPINISVVKRESEVCVSDSTGAAEVKEQPSSTTPISNGNSIIISSNEHHKLLPSILALNGISADSNILTSALMSSSNSFTILSPNTYNLLRSVGSLTVAAAQTNSIPLLNTACVSLSNNSTSSQQQTHPQQQTTIPVSVAPAKTKTIVAISSAQQQTAPTAPAASSGGCNADPTSSKSGSAASSTTTTPLRSISTITTSRQSVPSQVRLSGSQVAGGHSTKLYKCRYCPKTFNRKFCRERHERLHTGIKPYTCEICNDKFIRLEDKKRHVRSTHQGRDSVDLNQDISGSNSPEPKL